MNGRVLRRVFLLATALASTSADAQGFFGPTQPTAWQPELDAYVRLADGLRLQGQVQPYLVPQQGLAQCTFGVYGTLLVADVFRPLLSPDRAKTHAIETRLGVLYTPTFATGTSGMTGSLWTLQAEATPRVNLPLQVLASLRNRVSFNWGTGGMPGFTFRYRGRLQLEREFAVGRTPLTPYANVEFFWQQAPAQWTQFRMQGGLQVGFDAFAAGQTVELNFSAVTGLEPSRTWTPLVGAILSTYF